MLRDVWSFNPLPTPQPSDWALGSESVVSKERCWMEEIGDPAALWRNPSYVCSPGRPSLESLPIFWTRFLTFVIRQFCWNQWVLLDFQAVNNHEHWVNTMCSMPGNDIWFVGGWSQQRGTLSQAGWVFQHDHFISHENWWNCVSTPT